MKVAGGVHSVPKHGNSNEENEDAYWPRRIEGHTEIPFVCAIADGATETSYAGLWATLLVEGVCQLSEETDTLESQIQRLREQWAQRIPHTDLPWYAEQKLEMGAFTTLLGLNILSSERPERAIAQVTAIGDSCFFHIRSGQVVASFPATTHKELLARPLLVSSKLDAPDTIADLVKEASIECETGDVVVLATDALSGWIFSQQEAGSDPVPALQEIFELRQNFPTWIANLREQSTIKNDDCTMLWLVIEE